MKNKTAGIFTRISILVFGVIAILSVLFIIITYLVSTYFNNATTELLNKDVALHIAKFTSPFENDSINKQKADSVFYNAMVLNPSVEVYFLDTSGKVIYYQSPDTTVIEMHTIPLDDIKEFIYSGGNKYVTDYDPKHAGIKKIFSAAQVYKNDRLLGYIYVIIGSSAYGNASSILFGSYVWQLAITASIAVILLSVFLSLSYIKRLQHNYKKVIAVLDEYKNGNFNAQFEQKGDNEFTPITEAFNSITSLLASNMTKLQKSEGDRKDLIATISHDLQSPLSVAKGYAETILMQNGFIKDEQREYLKMVQLKIIQVEKMVAQLAELSRMEEVNFKLHKEPFVFTEIVQETVHTYQLIAAEKNINIKCTECRQHVWINADISMMERAIQNLADNAIKNTSHPGRIEIFIAVEAGMLTFTIENTGKPLSQQFLKWINSNEEELSDRPPEAGLGILIVKKILRLHHSSLQALRNADGNIFKFAIATVSQPASV